MAITVRAATLEDLDKLTSFAVPLVLNDDFHPYFFPGQNDHPLDHYQWWQSYYRDWIVKPWVMFLIAEVTTTKEIVGLAFWQYEPLATSNPGDTTVPKPHGLDTLEKDPSLVIGEDTLSGKKTDNRAVSTDRLIEFGTMMSEISKRVWSDDNRIHWYCPELFVSATPYKEAAFEKLLAWGVQQSEKDKTPVFAISQIPDIGSYEAMGMYALEKFECGTARGCLLKRNQRN